MHLPAAFRLIVDPPLTGPRNMARDEALLEFVGNHAAPPTLRFYAWSPATISLGYFQGIAQLAEQPEPIAGLPVVRRTTGGGAILHDLEVTYSLVVPADDPRLRPNPNELYRLAHRAIMAAVGPPARLFGDDGLPGACGEGIDDAEGARAMAADPRRGPFFCFARRHALDIVIPGSGRPADAAKLAGSAQRRTNQAVLQHGSIILDSRFPQQPCATWSALGGPRAYAEAVALLQEAFARALGMPLVRGALTRPEVARAAVLEEKYASREWTRRR